MPLVWRSRDWSTERKSRGGDWTARPRGARREESVVLRRTRKSVGGLRPRARRAQRVAECPNQGLRALYR